MSEIDLNVTINTGATIISNAFIERFINDANAAHLRLYLYLMYYSSSHKSFSISSACDFLEDSEKDIIRSINYWEKQGVFSVTRADKNTITSISISDLASSVEPKNKAKQSPATAVEETVFTHPDRECSSAVDFKSIISQAARLAGRQLSASEIDFLCDLNEKLNFSEELIIYLYEYCCVQKNINRFNYIESVALAWADKNFTSVNQAKTEAETFNKENALVMKAFGLSRLPGTSELEHINRWFHEYNMPDELVLEACNRTMKQLAKPDFSYAGNILKRWNTSGIKTLGDVAENDKLYYMTKQALNPVSTAPAKPANNRFANFDQRQYEAEEMSDITKKLLNLDRN